MRKYMDITKEATTVAVGVPLAYLSMLVSGIALGGVWGVVAVAERLTRHSG